jgi:hypothetical protein
MGREHVPCETCGEYADGVTVRHESWCLKVKALEARAADAEARLTELETAVKVLDGRHDYGR